MNPAIRAKLIEKVRSLDGLATTLQAEIDRAQEGILDLLDELLVDSTTPEVPALSPRDLLRGQKVAVVVGHSRQGDRGARSVDGTSEWDYNRKVGLDLEEALRHRDVPVWYCDDIPAASYNSAMAWAADQMRARRVTLAVELHFNSAGPSAAGYEYLYWHTSRASGTLADHLQQQHALHWPQAIGRGAKSRYGGDRGSGFLLKTPCPAVICEPFFGTNRDEWERYRGRTGELAATYAAGILSYLGVPS